MYLYIRTLTIYRTVVILHPLQPVYDRIQDRLRPLAADAACELGVLGHDGGALGMGGAEVSVSEEADEVCFSGFLEGEDSGRLPPEPPVQILRDLFHKALEGGLANEKLGGLLVATDVAEGDGPRSVAMRFLEKKIRAVSELR